VLTTFRLGETGGMSVEVNANLIIPDAELGWKFTRSGGLGGQHANKASIRVELTWHIGASVVVNETQRQLLVEALGDVVRIVADDNRSQARNREIAEQRLADKARAALVTKRSRRSTRPTPGSRRRRVEQKRRTGETKRLRQKPRHDD